MHLFVYSCSRIRLQFRVSTVNVYYEVSKHELQSEHQKCGIRVAQVKRGLPSSNRNRRRRWIFAQVIQQPRSYARVCAVGLKLDDFQSFKDGRNSQSMKSFLMIKKNNDRRMICLVVYFCAHPLYNNLENWIRIYGHGFKGRGYELEAVRLLNDYFFEQEHCEDPKSRT